MEKKSFQLVGRVETVLITATNGPVTSETYGFGSVSTTPVRKIQVVRGYGVRGDRHAGTRLADIRDRALLAFGFSKGTEIMNLREFSMVSIEELQVIVTAMALPTPIPYGCLGENLVVSGIPKLTDLPTGTMLFFRKNEEQMRTAVLIVWGENAPCKGPGEAIESQFPTIPGLASQFPKAAIGKRGIVGSVYVSGNIYPGDTIIAAIPRQRIYSL